MDKSENRDLEEPCNHVPGDHQCLGRWLASLSANQSGEITRAATVPLIPGGGRNGPAGFFLAAGAEPGFPGGWVAPRGGGIAAGGNGSIFFVSIKVTLTNLCQRGLQGFFIHGHAYSFIMASVSSSLRCCCFVLCTDEPTELFTSFFLANGLTWFTMCHWPSFLSEWMCRCCSFGSSLTPCYWTCQTRPRSNSVAVVALGYGNTGCWLFKLGVQNQKVFGLRINIPEGKYWILKIDVVASSQILGLLLVTKLLKN